MHVNGDPRRFTRRWFGGIFFGCWGLLILIDLARAAFGWSRGGLVYRLVYGPLLVAFVGAGVPWLGLWVRDALEHPRQVWGEARPWILGCGGVAALAFVAQRLLG
jgi:hypothetical protein